VHAHLREVHAKLAHTEAELQAVSMRELEQRDQLLARDQQLELSRAKLRSTAGGGKSVQGQVEALAESATAAREELKVKGEQLALLRQGVQVLEQENQAKEQRAEVLRERQALLERELFAKDDELMVLSEQLQTSQMEIKVGGSQLGRRNEGLQLEMGRLKKSLVEAEARADSLQRREISPRSATPGAHAPTRRPAVSMARTITDRRAVSMAAGEAPPPRTPATPFAKYGNSAEGRLALLADLYPALLKARVGT